MLPVKEAITIRRGDTFTKIVEGVLTSLAPLDVNGWTAVAQWRPKKDSPTVQTFTVTKSVTETNTVLHLELKLSAVQTAAITENGVWDLQVTGPSGAVTTWVEGPAYFEKDVTA